MRASEAGAGLHNVASTKPPNRRPNNLLILAVTGDGKVWKYGCVLSSADNGLHVSWTDSWLRVPSYQLMFLPPLYRCGSGTHPYRSSHLARTSPPPRPRSHRAWEVSWPNGVTQWV